MAPAIPDGLERLPVGSVVEQRQEGRTFLVVREAPDKTSIIESWDDGLDLVNRVLGELNRTLKEMVVNRTATNERLAAGLRKTAAKIAANQPLIDRLIKGKS